MERRFPNRWVNPQQSSVLPIPTSTDTSEESKLSIFVDRNSYLNIQVIKDLELGGKGMNKDGLPQLVSDISTYIQHTDFLFFSSFLSTSGKGGPSYTSASYYSARSNAGHGR